MKKGYQVSRSLPDSKKTKTKNNCIIPYQKVKGKDFLMVDVVFSEMIHKLSGFTVLELQCIKEIWMAELKRNSIGIGIQLACASVCDEIVAYKQQK